MRTPLPLPLLTLAAIAVAASLASPPRSAEGADDAQEERDRALCERVVASPVTLSAAVERATAGERLALTAGFAFDTQQRLTLSVTTVAPGRDADDFEEMRGVVLADRWESERRPLADRSEVAAAARAQTVLARGEWTIARALASTADALRERPPKAPSAAISARPATIERRACLVVEVAVGGVPLASRFDLADGRVGAFEPPAYVKEREAAARRRVGRPLPELAVEGGRWLHAKSPPTVAKRDGRPLLVLLTNRLCEMECGPSPDVVARWHERYGPRGLDVVTIYRDRASWKPGTSIDEMAALVEANGLRHPVLLDWKDAYIQTLEPGPVGYPVAYVVGPDGIVAWEGSTSRKAFESECEAAVERALRSVGPTAAKGADR